MNQKNVLSPRRLSVLAFSFSFVYLLTFLFEGQLLYHLLETQELRTNPYTFAAMIAHLFGLLSSGLFVQSQKRARSAMLVGMGICFVMSYTFLLPIPTIWFFSLIVSGYCSGVSVAAWGYFLRAYTPAQERIKACAEVLIYSNVLMILVQILTASGRSLPAYLLSVCFLALGLLFIYLLPREAAKRNVASEPTKTRTAIRQPLLLLCLFIFIITINSGLMYRVIQPAFSHLVWLTCWYWALPYVGSIAAIRYLVGRTRRTGFLYLAMGMTMAAFIGFMLLGRGTLDYLIVDTLLLGACGIFDLFWWSILGEMLDYTRRPALVFGFGLAANVFGVLFGSVLGLVVTTIGLPVAEITVIALTVVCATLVLLPPLNRQLLMLLKNHTYLIAYDQMSAAEQTAVVSQIRAIDPLTAREEEVLQLILRGLSNRAIAEALFISENTVKTHARNIYSKYDVSGRTELISTLLKNQSR